MPDIHAHKVYVSRFFLGGMCKSCKSRCPAMARIRLRGKLTTCNLDLLSHLIEYAAYAPGGILYLLPLRAHFAPEVGHSAHGAGADRRLHMIADRYYWHASKTAR